MTKGTVKNVKDIPIHKAPEGITYKKIASGSSIEPVEVDYVPLKNGESIPGHIHEKSNAFVFVIQGSATIVLGEKEFIVGKEDIIDIPAGTWHQFHASQKEDFLFLSIQYPPIEKDYVFHKKK